LQKHSIQAFIISFENYKKNTKLTELKRKQMKNITASIAKDTELYPIDNAGLVLLHPFLSICFDRLKYLKDGVFINNEASWRAVFLLQYIADGAEEDTYEYRLLLNKILCGIAIHDALPHYIELTEEEKNMGLQLLEAILQQWEKLKDTSVEGLRQTFLQRRGALSLNEDRLKLKVEHRAYDLFLQSLPWSFSMVKTKWMNKELITDWI
jgi:hypothetical protein